MAKKTEKKTAKKVDKKTKATSKKRLEKPKTSKTSAKKSAPKKTETKKKSTLKEVKKVQPKKKEIKTKKTKVEKTKKESVAKEKKIQQTTQKIKEENIIQNQPTETLNVEGEIDPQVLAEMEAARRRAEALKKIKKYSKKELEHFKSIIIEKQNEIIEQLQVLREQMLDPATGEYINENSPYSLHMAEQGTDAMEREKVFLYAQRETKFLTYLEEALKRIEEGTYGICIACIEEPQYLCPTCPLIPKERLEAVPHTQLCLPMKQRQEKK
ncbi:MAG: conjugal transfer protein TraR [Ignavibacterium sp.]|nr:conjugal transfer protein TraR [Ignavibacterium sp.]